MKNSDIIPQKQIWTHTGFQGFSDCQVIFLFNVLQEDTYFPAIIHRFPIDGFERWIRTIAQ